MNESLTLKNCVGVVWSVGGQTTHQLSSDFDSNVSKWYTEKSCLSCEMIETVLMLAENSAFTWDHITDSKKLIEKISFQAL